jgi:hypothetical protein
MESPYPQYFASPSAEQEFIVESEAEGKSEEFFNWMSSHTDAIWLRWKDGVPVDDEQALRAASVNAIVGDWVNRNVGMQEVNGQRMFRLRGSE